MAGGNVYIGAWHEHDMPLIRAPFHHVDLDPDQPKTNESLPPASSPFLIAIISSSLNSGSVNQSGCCHICPKIWTILSITIPNSNFHLLSEILERAVTSLLKFTSPPINPWSYSNLVSTECLPLQPPTTSFQGTLDTSTSLSLTWHQRLTPTVSPKPLPLNVWTSTDLPRF